MSSISIIHYGVANYGPDNISFTACGHEKSDIIIDCNISDETSQVNCKKCLKALQGDISSLIRRNRRLHYLDDNYYIFCKSRHRLRRQFNIHAWPVKSLVTCKHCLCQMAK